MRQSRRFWLRLIVCCLGGIAGVLIAMPYVLASGLALRNFVLACALGSVLFFVFALVAGLIWRQAIMSRRHCQTNVAALTYR